MNFFTRPQVIRIGPWVATGWPVYIDVAGYKNKNKKYRSVYLCPIDFYQSLFSSWKILYYIALIAAYVASDAMITLILLPLDV